MSDRVFLSQFSPQRTDPEALEQILVQRHELLAESVDRVRTSVLTANKHHLLFIGPRGAGKSHLVTLIHHRLARQTDLADHLRFAWLNEDETSTSFLKLLLRIHRDLSSRYPNEFPASDVANVYGSDADTARLRMEEILVNRLGGRTLVLLLENLDALFLNLDEVEQRSWRAFLQNHPIVSTIGTAQALFDGVANRDLPFFGFFEAHTLRALSVDDATTLLENIARLNGQTDLLEFLGTARGKARIRAIHHLSGGNPRLYIILSDFLTRDSLDSLVRPFEETVDKQLTAYYQERLRWLSAQQQEIVQLLCRQAHPIPVKEIAEGIFAAHTTVTSQLKQLREKGYVRAHPRGREVLYELAEPLMRLSFQVKQAGNRQPLALIVDFLRVWYDKTELQERMARLSPAAAEHAYFAEALARLDSGEPNLRLELLRFGVDGIDLQHCDDDALEQLELVATESGAAQDWLNLGFARFCRKNFLGAVKATEQALALSMPNGPLALSARLIYGNSLFQLQRWRDAIVAFGPLVDNDASEGDLRASVLTVRAFAHEASGDLDGAMADYAAVIESDSVTESKKSTAKARLVRCQFRKSLFDDALAFAETLSVADLEPTDIASATVIRGALRSMRERHEDALADFKLFFKLGAHTTKIGETGVGMVCDFIIYELAALVLKPAHMLENIIEISALLATHGFVGAIGEALIRNLVEVEDQLSADGLARWVKAWEKAGAGHPQLEIPLKLLRTGATFLKSRDENALLALAIEERSVLRQALGLAPEAG